MEKQPVNVRSGAIGAILDEYEKALQELKIVIATVTDAELVAVVDPKTDDFNCKSIQNILAHVVRAGYTYIIMINSLKAPIAPFRDRIYRKTAAEFIQDLDTMFAFNETSLAAFSDAELEEFDDSKKLLSSWDQRYDAEQLLEHAIVHVLRHRRQIEGSLRVLRGNAGSV